jgi:hypothetical protein
VVTVGLRVAAPGRRILAPDPAGIRRIEEGDVGQQRTRVVDNAFGAWGFFFLLAYIGAAIYFIGHSDGSFWGVILGLLQAAVWPVYVIYHTLVLLGV